MMGNIMTKAIAPDTSLAARLSESTMMLVNRAMMARYSTM